MFKGAVKALTISFSNLAILFRTLFSNFDAKLIGLSLFTVANLARHTYSHGVTLAVLRCSPIFASQLRDATILGSLWIPWTLFGEGPQPRAHSINRAP